MQKSRSMKCAVCGMLKTTLRSPATGPVHNRIITACPWKTLRPACHFTSNACNVLH